jgi:hypothetical protein
MMPIFGWEQDEVQPTDPPIVLSAEKHLSDGKPMAALLGLVTMVAGAAATQAIGPIGLIAFAAGAVVCLANMPRTIRRLAIALAVMSAVIVILAATT